MRPIAWRLAFAAAFAAGCGTAQQRAVPVGETRRYCTAPATPPPAGAPA